jgi:hypothetical protein
MPQVLDTIFDTPELHCLAFEADDALFIQMDSESYHSSIFLDHRVLSLGGKPIRIPIAPLIAKAREHTVPQTGWIFHLAHCGSTLLSRMLDSSESALILREPPPLRQLGVLAAGGNRSGDWANRLKLAYALAARRFGPSQPTAVKANVPVNFIIPQIFKVNPDAPMILLYLALEPYLLAVLREPRRRAWVDRVTRLLEPALAIEVGLDPSSNTTERAAALWLAQILIFGAVLATNGCARSLDAEAFFAAPIDAAATAAKHLGLTFSEAAGTRDELLSAHSKDPSRHFDETARRQRQEKDRIALAEDLARARRWIEQAAASRDLPKSLSRPLFGTASPLLA